MLVVLEQAADDYVAGLVQAYDVADYFTVNISSPNTPGLRALQTGQALQALLGRLSETRAALKAQGASFFGELLKRTTRHHPEEPHWYLAVFGSDTSVRGKGYGQALMRSRLDRVDAEHAPAYLESSKAENVPYYQRFGFEVTGEIVLSNGGPTLWPMWRAPR